MYVAEESMRLEVEAPSYYIPLIPSSLLSGVRVPDLVNEQELCDRNLGYCR